MGPVGQVIEAPANGEQAVKAENVKAMPSSTSPREDRANDAHSSPHSMNVDGYREPAGRRRWRRRACTTDRRGRHALKSLLAATLAGAAVLACGGAPPSAPAADPSPNTFGAGDFGDAPDPSYPALLSSNGARTRDVTGFWLGIPDVRPTTEDEAKVVDRDEADDGATQLLATAGRILVTFRATRSGDAPAGTVYFNLLGDSNGDGRWRNFPGPAGEVREWVVVNRELHLEPGATEEVRAEVPLAFGTLETWIRAALTDRPIDAANFPDGWDGTGAFDAGEIEDHHVKPVIDWNVECDPRVLAINHDGADNITLRIVAGAGAPDLFRIVSVTGDDPADITVTPLGMPFGPATLYGPGPHIRVAAAKFNGPPHSTHEFIAVRLDDLVSGRVENQVCEVRVTHTAPIADVPPITDVLPKPTPLPPEPPPPIPIPDVPQPPPATGCRVVFEPSWEISHETTMSVAHIRLSVLELELLRPLPDVELRLTAYKPDGTTSQVNFRTPAGRPAEGTVTVTKPGDIRVVIEVLEGCQSTQPSFDRIFHIGPCPSDAMRCPGPP